MREPANAEELAAYLDRCDQEIRASSTRSVELAEAAMGYIERLSLSPYRRRNFRVRASGVLAAALAASGRRTAALEFFQNARSAPSDPAERASLAIRLAQFFAEDSQLGDAYREAEHAVSFFLGRRPKNETDLRSLAGALVARANVAFSAFLLNIELAQVSNLVEQAEVDYNLALRSCSVRTEACSFAAITNLGNLAIRCWWTGHDGPSPDPMALASNLSKVCKRMTQRGIPFRSKVHARARWVYGLATYEAYGSLNREAENRLERALQDLLSLGAISDAAELALDLGYCYMKEQRWDDLLIVTTTIIQHPDIASIPVSWREALLIWKDAVEQHAIESVVSITYKTVRGIEVALEPAFDSHAVPRFRHSDRTDTLGF